MKYKSKKTDIPKAVIDAMIFQVAKDSGINKDAARMVVRDLIAIRRLDRSAEIMVQNLLTRVRDQEFEKIADADPRLNEKF